MTFKMTLLVLLSAGVVLLLGHHSAQAQQGPETFPPPAPSPVEARVDPVPVPPPVVGEANPPPARPADERPVGSDASPFGAPMGGRGMDLLGDFANPSFGNQLVRVAYGVTWFPREPVKDQNTNLQDVRQNFLISAPFYQDSCNQWGVSARVLNETVSTGAILPDTGREFPHELWNVSFGTNYSHLFDNGWIGGGSLHVGSASDRPFDGLRETTFGASAFLRVPQGEHNAWLFTLNFSTNSQVLNYIPIPGIAYLYAPVPWFQATIGFPFASVMYRPVDDLTLQVSYALLTTFHTRATYRLAPHFKAFGAFDINDESYLLFDRPDINDRFYYFDMRLTGGLQYELSRRALLEFSSGYAFDRHYFEARSITQQGFDRVDVSSGPFLGLQFRTSF